MPRILDYPDVLERLTRQGLVCNYHNSGSFAFAHAIGPEIRAWVGPEDETIRPEFRRLARAVAAPCEPILAERTRTAWLAHLAGVAWVMPTSHWAYELEFGSAAWMPALLMSVGLASAELAGRNNASAIEFTREEAALLEKFIRTLLERLGESDFMLAFPDEPALCLVHHNKQMWWMTARTELAAALETLV